MSNSDRGAPLLEHIMLETLNIDNFKDELQTKLDNETSWPQPCAID